MGIQRKLSKKILNKKSKSTSISKKNRDKSKKSKSKSKKSKSIPKKSRSKNKKKSSIKNNTYKSQIYRRNMMRGGVNEGTSIDVPSVDSKLWNHLNKHEIIYLNLPRATVVEAHVFKGCPNLVSVNMPRIQEIGDGAFRACLALREVVLPRSLTKLGREAFRGCTKLTTVTMPEDGELEEIGDYAFGDCWALTAVVLPRKLKKLGARAFEGCTQLESVKMPTGGLLQEIGNEPFLHCPPGMIIDFGLVKMEKIEELNQFPALTSFERNAKVIHTFGNANDQCIITHKWEPGETVLDWDTVDVDDVVDATGIKSPIQLQDLSGDIIVDVPECWSDGPGADFQQKVNQALSKIPTQEDDRAIRNIKNWKVEVSPNDDPDKATNKPDLNEVAIRLAKGELSLDDPWFLAWFPDDAGGADPN